MVSSRAGAVKRITKRGNGYISEFNEVLELVNKTRSWYLKKTRWTVSISSDNRLYDAAHRWFINHSEGDPPRSISARYVRRPTITSSSFKSGIEDDFDFEIPPATVEIHFDDRKDRKVTIDGHDILVSLVKPENTPVTTTDTPYRSYSVPEVLYFHATSYDGQQAVLELLRGLIETKEEIPPALFMLDRWSSWTKRDDLPPRTLESVVLLEGQMERLRDDIQEFLDSESEYVRRGIPYHRGYLLYGPPGTGKTSVVRALAHSLGLNLWYAPLGDLEKDSSLFSIVNEVKPRSILLLEDIDIFHAATARDDQTHTATMAGLLNALDGVATPHGLITFMTTNDLTTIDAAVLRPGRVDLTEHIDMPTPQQLARLWAQFYSQPIPYDRIVDLATFTGSTAAATEIFKQYLTDPQAALNSLTNRQSVNSPNGTTQLV